MQINSNQSNSNNYISSAWQQHAELVTHLCHFSQNILLIIGQPASGKSTFFEYFHTQSSVGLKTCALRATFDGSVESLLKAVAAGFALDWENATNTSQALISQATTSYQLTHETWVLTIDDAHLLSDEQITALLQLIQFNDEARAQLHLVLIGEPTLEARLFAPTLAPYAQGKIYSIELEPWTLHDLKRYLARNLALPPLTSEQIADIYARTRGIPGQVVHEERQRQNSLIEGANMTIKQSAKRWTHPIALGAVAGFLLGGAYLLVNNTQDEEIINSPINNAQVDESWEATSINKPRIDNSDEKMVMEDEPAPVIQKMNTAIVAAELPNVVTATLQTSAKISQEIVQPVENIQPTNALKAFSKAEEYLLSVDKHYYTLQLVGARNEKSVQQYLQKNHLKEQAYSYRTKLSGKDWYVVVLGEYTSMDEAKAAAASLPTHIAAKPWIREFSSVHNDIKKQG